MRTQSDVKVKHSHTSRACIDHCSREVCNAFPMSDERDNALADGRYDAFILSADPRDEGVAISCTITTGARTRGDVIDLVSTRSRRATRSISSACRARSWSPATRSESRTDSDDDEPGSPQTRPLLFLAAPSGFEPPLPP